MSKKRWGVRWGVGWGLRWGVSISEIGTEHCGWADLLETGYLNRFLKEGVKIEALENMLRSRYRACYV